MKPVRKSYVRYHMKKKTFIFIILNSLFFSLSGQIDNEFWFVAPEATINHGSNPGGYPIYFYFTTISDSTEIYIDFNAYKKSPPVILGTDTFDFKYKLYKVAGDPSLSTYKFNPTDISGLAADPGGTSIARNNFHEAYIENTYNHAQVVSSFASRNGLSGISNKGIYIKVVHERTKKLADSVKISCYYEIDETNNSDIFSLKGKNALGSEFWSIFQKDYHNVCANTWTVPAYSAIDVVFTENNTYIDVTVPVNKTIFNRRGNLLGGSTYTLGPFQKGETFSMPPAWTTDIVSPTSQISGPKAVDLYFGRSKNDHLSGVKIVANDGTPSKGKKKIAVTLKDDSMYSSGAYDIGGDQIIPIDHVGSQYVVMRGGLASNIEKIYIQPTTNTSITVVSGYGNPFVQTRSRTYNVTTTDTVISHPLASSDSVSYISSSDGKKFYVLHLSGKGNTGNEMGQAILPSISTCTGSPTVTVTRTTVACTAYLNVMVFKGAESFFVVNGNVQDGSSAAKSILYSTKFKPLPGNNTWLYAQIREPLGFTSGVPYTITNTKDVFHLGTYYDFGSGARYGYFSGFNTLDLEATIVENPVGNALDICQGQSVELEVKNATKIRWEPTDFIDNPNIGRIKSTPPYTITYKAISEGYCNQKDTSAPKTITVKPQTSAKFNIDTTAGCSPISVNVSPLLANQPGVNVTYTFNGLNSTVNNSSFLNTFSNTSADTFRYTIKAISEDIAGHYACRDTFIRDLLVFPKVAAAFTPDTTINSCDSLSVSFENKSTNAHRYYWDFGDGNSIFDTLLTTEPHHIYRNFTPNNITYRANLIATSKFLCTDTAYNDFTVYPYIDAYFTVDSSAGCSGFKPKLKNASSGPIPADGYDFHFSNVDSILKINEATIDVLFGGKAYTNTSDTTRTDLLRMYVRNAKGCVDSFKREVTIYPRVIANFASTSVTGCNPLTVSFTPVANKPPVTYNWDFGNGNSRQDSTNLLATNIYNNSLNIDRNYTASLKVSFEDKCTAVAETTITAYSKVDANFALDKTVSCDSLKPLITNNSSFNSINDVLEWNFGDGSPVSNSKAATIPHKYTENITKNTGNLTNDTIQRIISLRVINPHACPDIHRDTIILYPYIRPGFIINKTSNCNPLQVTFTDTTNHPANQKYFWTFGNGISSTSQNPTSITYSHNKDTKQTYKVLLTVTSKDNICSDTVSKYIEVAPYLKAGFSVNKSFGCSPLDIIATNSSEGGVGIESYNWDFGDTSTYPTTSDPGLKTYSNTLNQADSITRILKLVISNTGGLCKDTFERTITVYPEVVADFDYYNTADSCVPHTVRFRNLSNNAANRFKWSFDDGSSSSSDKEPNYLFNHLQFADKTYQVKLDAFSKYDCSATVTKPNVVYSYIKAGFTSSLSSLCTYTPAAFRNTSIGYASDLSSSIKNSSWFFDFTNLSNDSSVNNDLNVSKSFTNTGDNNSIYKVVLKVENSRGCTDTFSRLITIHPEVISSFDPVTVNPACQPHEVQFNATVNTNVVTIYNWDFGDGSTSGDLNPPLHTFSNFSPNDSTYMVKLTASSLQGCTDTTIIPVKVYSFVDADFKVPKANVCPSESIDFKNASKGKIVKNYWYFGDNAIDSTDNFAGILHKYTNDGDKEIKVPVKLKVRNDYFSCTDSAFDTVTIYPNVIVDGLFAANTPQGCQPHTTGFSNTTDTRGATSWSWDFGDGSTSSEKIPSSHTFTNLESSDKTFNVTLTAKSATTECTDVASIPVTAYAYIDADFKLPVGSICSHDSFPVENVSKGGIVNYDWNFNNIDSRTTSSLTSFNYAYRNFDPIPSNNFIRLIVNNHDPVCTDTIIRNILIYPKVTAGISGDLAGCQPFATMLSDASTNASDLNWFFFDQSTDSRSTINRKFMNFTDRDATYTNNWLYTYSDYACADSIQFSISVNHKPKAVIALDKYIDCPPFDVVFKNESKTVKSQFDWIFGEPTDSTNEQTTPSTDPITFTYYNFDLPTPKTYNIAMTATTDSGCNHSTSAQIFVYPKVTAVFDSISPNCSPYDLLLTNKTTNATDYEWLFGDGATSNQVKPSHIYYNNTENIVDYVVEQKAISEYGCRDSAKRTVKVYPSPIADFTVEPTLKYYPEATFLLTNLTNKGNFSYLWDFGDGNQSTTATPESHTYARWAKKENQYIYRIGYKVFNDFCRDSTFTDVTLMPPIPITNFDSSKAGCTPVTVHFTNHSLWGDEYLWEFDDGTVSTTTHPAHTFINPGEYNVKLTVRGEGGESFQYKTVKVFPKPTVKFTVEPRLVMLPDDKIKCYNLTNDGTRYYWKFGDGNFSSEVDPMHEYKTLGKYDIELIAWSEFDCSDSMTLEQVVKVDGYGEIQYPNAFTPNTNGPNGGHYDPKDMTNNVFFPYYKGVAEYHMEIYNRWGELLFVSDNVDIGWDGYFKGKLCKQDVYAYKTKGKFFNGKDFVKSGDITLIHKND